MVLQSSGAISLSEINNEYYTNDNPLNPYTWYNKVTPSGGYICAPMPPTQILNRTWSGGDNTFTSTAVSGNSSTVNGSYIVTTSSNLGTNTATSNSGSWTASGNTLTLTTVDTGQFRVGMILSGTGINSPIVITAITVGTGGSGSVATLNAVLTTLSVTLTGTLTSLPYFPFNGGMGNDNTNAWINSTQTYNTTTPFFYNAATFLTTANLSSGSLVATASAWSIETTTLTITTLASGSFQIGMLLTGTGVAAGTYIKAFNTGTNGVSTYILNQSTTGNTGTLTGTISTSSNSQYYGEYLQLQVPTAISLNSFVLTPQKHVLSRAPANFAIMGSNNGTNWILIHLTVNFNSWPNSNPRLFNIAYDRTNTYTFFRFIIMSVNGNTPITGGYCAIGSLELNSQTPVGTSFPTISTTSDINVNYNIGSTVNGIGSFTLANTPIQNSNHFVFQYQLILQTNTGFADWIRFRFGDGGRVPGVDFTFALFAISGGQGIILHANQTGYTQGSAFNGMSAYYSDIFLVVNRVSNIMIVYNKGTVNTWQLYINGIQYFNYSDPNNLGWVNNAGSTFSLATRTGGQNFLGMIRQLSLKTSIPFEICNSYNWYQCMVPVNYVSTFSPTFTGRDPLVQVQLCNSSGGVSIKQSAGIYNMFPVQNYAAFTLTFQFYIINSGSNGDYIDVFVGNTNQIIQATSFDGANNSAIFGNNYGYHIGWTTSVTSNVYITNNTSTLARTTGGLPIFNSWNTITINYNRGNVGTWAIGINGTNVLNYSDSNNQNWVNNQAGNYWGITSQSDLLTTFVRQVSMVVIPYSGSNSQKLLTPLNYYKEMTIVKSNGSYNAALTLNDPLTQIQLSTTSSTNNGNSLYINNPIQNSNSFIMQFEYLYNGGADYVMAFFGSPTTNSTGSFRIMIMIWTGYTNGAGMYILNEAGAIVYFSPMNWLFQNNWISVTIAYTKGAVNTWVINHNGQYFSYSNATNSTWLTTAGRFAGLLANSGGGQTLTAYVRKVQLSLVPGTIAPLSRLRIANGPSNLSQLPPILTGNSTTISGNTNTLLNGNYTASASSAANGTTAAAYSAFAGVQTGSNGWLTGSASYTTGTSPGIYTGTAFQTTVSSIVYNGEWLQIQVPNPLSVESFIIYPQNTSTLYGRAPSTFILAGSINGSTWAAIHIASSPLIWVSSNPQTFVCNMNNINSYNYFRLVVTAISNNTLSDAAAAIGYFQLYTNNSASNPLYKLPPNNMGGGSLTVSGNSDVVLNGLYVATSSSTFVGGDAWRGFAGVPGGATNRWESSNSTYVSGIFNTTRCSSTSGSIVGNIFTAGGTISGAFGIGMLISGVGIPNGTIITGAISGTVFYISNSTSVSGIAVTGSFGIFANGTIYNGEWLQLQVPISINLNSFTIYPQITDTFYLRTPSTFVVVGSNDILNWTILHNQSTPITWTSENPKAFTCNRNNNTDKFIYFRIVVMTISGLTSPNNVSIGYLQLNSFTDNGPIRFSQFYRGTNTQAGMNSMNLLASDQGPTNAVVAVLSADSLARFIEMPTSNLTGKRYVVSQSYRNIFGNGIRCTLHIAFNDFVRIYHNKILIFTDAFADLNNFSMPVILTSGVNTFDIVCWKNNTGPSGLIYSLRVTSTGIVLMRSDNNSPVYILPNCTKTTVTATPTYLCPLNKLPASYTVGAAYGLTKLNNNYTASGVVNVTRYTVPMSLLITDNVGIYNIYYTTDYGETYTACTGISSIFPDGSEFVLIGLATGETTAGGITPWIIAGYNPFSLHCVMGYSSNGISFTPVSDISTIVAGGIRGISFGLINDTPMWIVVGSTFTGTPQNIISYTTNQLGNAGWTNALSYTNFDFFCIDYGIVSGVGGFVAGGRCVSGIGTNNVFYSTNGTSWTGVNVFNGATGICFSISSGIVGGTMGWIAGGRTDGSSNGVFYSVNGTSWISTTGIVASTISIVVSGMINGRPGWIISGGFQSNTPQLAYSTNGIYFKNVTGVFLEVYEIIWTERNWIATGTANGSTTDIAISGNGINWSYISGPSLSSFNTGCNYGGSGYGNIGTSASAQFYADTQGNLMTLPNGGGIFGTSLQNWLGGNTGFVTTWYDQGGAGNHLTQGTGSSQPAIIWNITQGAWCVDSQNTSSQFLSRATSPLPTGTVNLPYTFAVKVGTIRNLGPIATIFFAGSAADNSSNALGLASNQSRNFWFNNDYTLGITYVTGNVYSFTYDGSNHYAYTNANYSGNAIRTGGTTTAGQPFYLLRDARSTTGNTSTYWTNGQVFYAIFLTKSMILSSLNGPTASTNTIVDGPISGNSIGIPNTGINNINTVLPVYSLTSNGLPTQNANVNQLAPLDVVSNTTKNSCRGAYGLILLNTAYTGPVVMIRRGIDNLVMDFYADIQGNLGTNYNGIGNATSVAGNSLASWLRGSTGYVVVWYDQSCNTNWNISSNTFTITNSTLNGTYIASASNSGGGTSPYMAFNNNLANYWGETLSYSNTTGVYTGAVSTTYGIGAGITTGQSMLGEWIQLRVPAPVQLTSFDLTSRQDQNLFTGRTPTTFIVLGSVDGTGWTLLHTETRAYQYAYGFRQRFIVNAGITNTYTYFRMVINIAGNGVAANSIMNISVWNLYTTYTTNGITLTNVQIPSNNNATQFIPAFQPVISPAVYYGNSDTVYVVDSQTSGTQFMNLPSNTVPTGTLNAPYTFLVRHGTFTNTTNGAMIGAGTTGVNNQANVLRANNSTSAYTHYWWNNDVVFGAAAQLTSGNQVCVTYDGGTRKVYINTNLLTSVASSGVLVSQDPQYLFTDKANEYLNGQMMYIYIFGSAIPDEDRLKLMTV